MRNRCMRCKREIPLNEYGYFDEKNKFYLCIDCMEEIFMNVLVATLNYDKRKSKKILKILSKQKYKEWYRKYVLLKGKDPLDNVYIEKV